MARVKIRKEELEAAIESSLKGAAMFLANKIHSITPRDPARPPKPRPSNGPIFYKTGSGKLAVIPKDRPQVTGNLKRSITYKKNEGKKMSYRIGVGAGMQGMKPAKNSPVDYAAYQEFGTRYIPPRSFLRKGLLDFKEETAKYFAQNLREFLYKK